MRAVGVVFLVGVLGLSVLGQPEFFQDQRYQGKPFNPGDVGMVMRAIIRDNDAADTDPVYFTRLALENLGTAGAEEIEWVELRMETSCGKNLVLAWGQGFPIALVLLDRPAEDRMIADDGEAVLTVWLKVTDKIKEGRTVQPKLTLGWAEGEKGGEMVLVDGNPEKFLVAGSFSARILAGPGGGNLNPGDQFPVAEIAVADTADVNPWGLDVVRIRIDGPKELVWLLDNRAAKVEVLAGQDYTLPERFFAALDEAKHTITIHVRVPEGFRPKEPVTLAPVITLWLAEAFHEQSFRLADPTPDRIVTGGFEEVTVSVELGGKVVDPATTKVAYSALVAVDQDRNSTPVVIHTLKLRALGTITEVASVEVVDQGGRLVGYGQGLAQPMSIVAPDGKPFLVPDEGKAVLQVNLSFSGRLPLGGSLLLAHDLGVEEKLPRDWLFRSDALTNFQGAQSLAPQAAVFFGKPTVRLAVVEDRAVLTTDGETVGLLAGSVIVSPAEFFTLSAQALSSYRLSTSLVEGGLSFSLEAGKPQAKGGDLAAFIPAIKPVRVPQKKMQAALELKVDKVVDWAGISLPFDLGPTRATFAFPVPVLGLLPTPERKDAVVIHCDAPVSAVRAHVRFDPELPVELLEVKGLGPFAASVEEEEKPEPGRVLVRVVLSPEKKPEKGALAELIFAKKVQEEVRIIVSWEILEVLGVEGAPGAFAVDSEEVELRF